MDEHTEPPEPRKPRWPHWPGRLPSDDDGVNSQSAEALPDRGEPSGAADAIAAEPTAAQAQYTGTTTEQPQVVPDAQPAPAPELASAGTTETGQGAPPPAAGSETVAASPADPLKSSAPETTVQQPAVPEQRVSEPAARQDSVSQAAAPDPTAPESGAAQVGAAESEVPESGVPRPPAPDPDEPQPDAEPPGVLEGEVLTEEEAAATRLKLRAERAVPDQRRLSPAALPAARRQMAGIVESEHRGRVPSLDDDIDAEAREYVTAALVRAMAFIIRTHIMPGVAISQDQMTDVLLKTLAEPRVLVDPADIRLKLPIAISEDVVSIDVSTGGGGEHPKTLLVHVGDGPEDWQPEQPEVEPEGPADFGSPNGSNPTASAADQEAAAPSAPETAAVIWGSAAEIANGSRYLSLDALMSYARDQIFAQIYANTAHSAAGGMRAVRDLEVIVLLDPKLGGGLWIDVDPDTGCPAATLAIELWSTVEDGGVWATLLTTRVASGRLLPGPLR
jgi:hypothetical protein